MKFSWFNYFLMKIYHGLLKQNVDTNTRIIMKSYIITFYTRTIQSEELWTCDLQNDIMILIKTKLFLILVRVGSTIIFFRPLCYLIGVLLVEYQLLASILFALIFKSFNSKLVVHQKLFKKSNLNFNTFLNSFIIIEKYVN